MGCFMDETLRQERANKGGDMSKEHAIRVARDAMQALRDRRLAEADQFNLDCSLEPLTDAVSSSVNETRKHSHYFKDVSGLQEIDIYRVCQLFGVDDPSGATQHALKKILLPGQRGAGKDRSKDLQEAVDTLNRKLEMMREDAQ